MMAVELLDLPYEPASAALARRTIVHVLRARGAPSDCCEDAALIVSELVGNAIRHGRPRSHDVLTVGWQLTDGRLHIEVTDGGGERQPAVRRTPPGVVRASGRGLEIVAALAQEWGTRRRRNSMTVWADLAVVGLGLVTADESASGDGLDPSEYEQAG